MSSPPGRARWTRPGCWIRASCTTPARRLPGVHPGHRNGSGHPGDREHQAAGHERGVLRPRQPGRQTEVTRTVTALTPGVYKATVDVPGVKVSVTPAVLNFSSAGEKRTFKVSFENHGAPLGQFATGGLTWQGANKNVSSPVAVRPQSSWPANVAFSSEGGTGPATSRSSPVPTRPSAWPLMGSPRRTPPAWNSSRARESWPTDASNLVKTVQVPAGRQLAKFSVFSSDQAADFDLYVMTPGGPADRRDGPPASRCPFPTRRRALHNVREPLCQPQGQPTKASLDAAVLGANVATRR